MPGPARRAKARKLIELTNLDRARGAGVAGSRRTGSIRGTLRENPRRSAAAPRLPSLISSLMA
jgi:hypothetical protein